MFIRKIGLVLVLVVLALSSIACRSEDFVPSGFKVLGTIVPPEYEPAPTHGFKERSPDTNTSDYMASAEEVSRGYVVYAKNYLDSVYPRTIPQPSEVTSNLSTFSASGEYEPITFSIYALDELADVSVAVSDLKGSGGKKITSNNIDVRSVRCWPKRVWENPAVNEYSMQPWFLEKRPLLDIGAGQSKRYWITVWVPSGTKADTYKGKVKINVGNGEKYSLDLAIEVLGVELMTSPVKQCIYYHMQDETNPVAYQPYPEPDHYYKDAVNMREHGLNAVFMMVPVSFSSHMEGDKAVFDLDSLEPFIGPCMDVGVDTVVFNMTLGWILPNTRTNCTGPSDDYGVNVRGFVDSFVAKGWKMPILSYGDESDAGDGWPQVVNTLKMSKTYAPEVKTYTTIVYPWNAEKFEPYLDIRAHALPDWRVVEPARAAGRDLWQYSGSQGGIKGARFYRGVWGSMLGLDGMSDWLYFMLYKKDAFFDDLVGGASAGSPNHRGFVIPAPDGPLPTLRWEGVREGAEDGKYLYTLKELIKEAKASGDLKLTALAAGAQGYLDGLYDKVDDIPEYELNASFPHSVVCGTIKDLKFFDNFRYDAGQYIMKLQEKLSFGK